MDQCALEQIVSIIGDRWSLLLVCALLAGPRRTTELASVLSPISTRTLAERLKRLEGAGLLSRRAYPEAPPRVEYELTERGQKIRPILVELRRTFEVWGGEACLGCTDRTCGICELDAIPSKTNGGDADAAPKHQPAWNVDVTLL